LIDDTPAVGKVRMIYPQASLDVCNELVVRVVPFNFKSINIGNNLVEAAQEALRRVTSPGWGVRCPTSGKRTARQNPPQTKRTSAGVNLSFCCAEHKNNFKE
jgi:hypothetical protein